MEMLLIFFAVFPGLAFSQHNYTLSGKITDAKTGEDQIGVSVLIVELVKVVATNSYGFYSLSLPEGTYTIRYSFIGYENVQHVLKLNKNYIINIEISPSVIALNEVIVSTERNNKEITSALAGVEKIDLKDIENIPVLFAERDILKTIQLLPGISNSAEV